MIRKSFYRRRVSFPTHIDITILFDWMHIHASGITDAILLAIIDGGKQTMYDFFMYMLDQMRASGEPIFITFAEHLINLEGMQDLNDHGVDCFTSFWNQIESDFISKQKM